MIVSSLFSGICAVVNSSFILVLVVLHNLSTARWTTLARAEHHHHHDRNACGTTERNSSTRSNQNCKYPRSSQGVPHVEDRGAIRCLSQQKQNRVDRITHTTSSRHR